VQFDPEMVEVFFEVFDVIKSIQTVPDSSEEGE
jgi:response regulator RpfG family c-di-GMP phosphodiesterase